VVGFLYRWSPNFLRKPGQVWPIPKEAASYFANATHSNKASPVLFGGALLFLLRSRILLGCNYCAKYPVYFGCQYTERFNWTTSQERLLLTPKQSFKGAAKTHFWSAVKTFFWAPPEALTGLKIDQRPVYSLLLWLIFSAQRASSLD